MIALDSWDPPTMEAIMAGSTELFVDMCLDDAEDRTLGKDAASLAMRHLLAAWKEKHKGVATQAALAEMVQDALQAYVILGSLLGRTRLHLHTLFPEARKENA